MSNQSNTPDSYSANTRREPARLFLSPNTMGEQRGFLNWLCEFYGLKVYGNFLLSRRAATEMRYAALLLTIIFTFDLFAWGALWNMVVHGSDQKLSFLTVFALIGGLLFAGAIFIYERQFITADIGANKLGTSLAMTIRTVVLVLAALVTSQPVEVIVFKGPLKERIHEESVIVHAAQYLDDLKKAPAPAESPSGENQGQPSQPVLAAGSQDQEENLNELERKALADLDRDLKEARQKGISAEADKQSLQQRISRQDSYIASLRSRCTQKTEAGINACNRLPGARLRKGQLEAALNEAEKSIAKSEIEKKQLKQSDIIAQASQKLNEPIEKRKALKKWIDEINNAAPGVAVPAPSPLTFQPFTDKPYDFFKRLRILEDFKDGRPAQLPDKKLTNDDKEYLALNLRVPGLADSQEANALRNANANIFRWQYRIVYFISMVIPLLVIAFKLLIPAELKNYYSSQRQAEAGNIDAMRFTTRRPNLQNDRSGGLPPPQAGVEDVYNSYQAAD